MKNINVYLLTLLLPLALFFPNTLIAQSTEGKSTHNNSKNLIDPGSGGFDDGGEGYFPCYTCTAAFSRDISYCLGQRDIDRSATNTNYIFCSGMCAIMNGSGDSVADHGLCALQCGAQLWQDNLNTDLAFEDCVDQVIYREHYCRIHCQS